MVAAASCALSRGLIALAATLAASLALWASQPPSQPAFRSGVELVTIDVAVLGRDDQIVEGVTPEDFVVTIDGAPRRIATFRFVRAGSMEVSAPSPQPAPPVAEPTPQPVPGRTIVIVVDRDQIPVGGGRVFLEAGARFVDSLGPNDRVGLWTLPVTSDEVQHVQDREQLKRLLLASVGTLRPPASDVKMSPDEAFGIAVLTDARVRGEVIERECTRSLSARPENLQLCVRQIDLQAPQMVRDLEAAAQTILVTVRRLVESLAPIEGAKHVVLISMGTYVTPDLLAQVRAVGDAAAAARVHLHALQASNVLEAVRVDITGLGSLPQSNQLASANYMLAGITGGLAITTPAGEVAFTRLSRVLAAAYILGVETESGDRDGKTHRIDVRVARREGLTVRARQQFRIEPTAAVTTLPALPASPAPSAAAAPPAPATAPAPGSGPASTPAGRAGRTLVEALAGLTAYIESFEREFASAVAEERYVQIVRPWRGNPRSPADEKALEWTAPGQKVMASGPIIARRLLLSDVLLVQIPGERWLGYRDVASVDGKPIRDRTERVRDLFLSKAADREEQLRRVADESARYNLGDFKRNLNLPTLPLFFMHPRYQARFEFDGAGEQAIDGVKMRVIRYRERQRPTLIGTSGGRDVPIEGRIWIDPASGHVVQTEIRFEPLPERRAAIHVRYRRQDPFTVLVPDYMWEWYESGDVSGRVMSDKTLVECLARYTNFRQFRVTTIETIK